MLAGLVSLLAVSSAFAYSLNYGGVPPNERFYSPHEEYVGPRHSLAINDVMDYRGEHDLVCAKYLTADGGPPPNGKVCRYASAEQQYCDCNLKYPIAKNGQGIFNSLFGTIYY